MKVLCLGSFLFALVSAKISGDPSTFDSMSTDSGSVPSRERLMAYVDEYLSSRSLIPTSGSAESFGETKPSLTISLDDSKEMAEDEKKNSAVLARLQDRGHTPSARASADVKDEAETENGAEADAQKKSEALGGLPKFERAKLMVKDCLDEKRDAQGLSKCAAIAAVAMTFMDANSPY